MHFTWFRELKWAHSSLSAFIHVWLVGPVWLCPSTHDFGLPFFSFILLRDAYDSPKSLCKYFSVDCSTGFPLLIANFQLDLSHTSSFRCDSELPAWFFHLWAQWKSQCNVPFVYELLLLQKIFNSVMEFASYLSFNPIFPTFLSNIPQFKSG